MKKLTAVILVVSMIFALSGCSVFEYFESLNEELITSHVSPDGKYTVTLYQVGSPTWSFGPVDAKLVLTGADGHQIAEKTVSLMNDGSGVAASNIYTISWKVDHVAVVLMDLEGGKKQTCVLNYE